MAAVDPVTVEKYQRLLESDPTSRVFAPLAEAYRQMGMTKEAEEVCRAGLKNHPDFAGGRITLARLYLDAKDPEKARRELEHAVRHNPDNTLALSLLAETLLRLRETKAALSVYKKLLFIAPDHEKALTAVRKLESLTATDYDNDVFEMRPVSEVVKTWDKLDLATTDLSADGDLPGALSPKEQKSRVMDRILSLADAHFVRNDTDKALEALTEGERLFGSDPEIVKRLKLIHQKQLDQIVVPKTAAELTPPPSRRQQGQNKKLTDLQNLKSRFLHLKKSNDFTSDPS
jgi:tetratricopeptide (TPR) repeat protein